MTLAELNRLRAAHTLLAGDGLHVGDFAQDHAVSSKTVFRLLIFLKADGYPSEVITDGVRNSHPSYRHFYVKGVQAMFAKRK